MTRLEFDHPQPWEAGRSKAGRGYTPTASLRRAWLIL